jgi:hypothetical protein
MDADASYEVRARFRLARTPHAGERVVLTIERDGQSLERRIVTADTTGDGSAVDVRAAGSGAADYVVKLEENGELRAVDVAMTRIAPCFAGARRLMVAFPQRALVYAHNPTGIRNDDAKAGAYISAWQWLAQDDQPAWIAEYWRDGRRAAATQGRADPGTLDMVERGPSDAACAFGYREAFYAVPDEVMTRLGEWEARLYRERQQPITVEFTVPGGGADIVVPTAVGVAEPSADVDRRLAAVPARGTARPASEYDNPLRATPTEVRALTRSRELFEARRAFNLAVMPQGFAGTPTPSALQVTDEERSRLGAQQLRDLDSQRRRAMDAEEAAAARARRARALQQIPLLRRMIAEHGQPWNEAEAPRPVDLALLETWAQCHPTCANPAVVWRDRILPIRR